MWFLYAVFSYLYLFVIRISAFWNTKARAWIDGRKYWEQDLKTFQKKDRPRVWFHVASLGEFEQAKPVIEQIKAERPEVEIFLSFFSPSGFLQKKNYQPANVIYLPADLPGNAELFLKYIQPDVAVFVKYDLWPGYLRDLHRLNITSYVISAHWNPKEKFSSWSGPLTQTYLKSFRKIFQQRDFDRKFFHRKGFQNIEVSGDTRIDRSLLLPNETDKIPSALRNINFDLIAGSTWPGDEEILLPVVKKLKLKTIIAPHDVSPANIRRLASKVGDDYQLLSELESSPFNTHTLIVDSIGVLSVLYALGRIAYVGGGFGKGIHNVLEPAAHGLPVIFGPKHFKFPEAEGLINIRGGFSVYNAASFEATLNGLLEAGHAKSAGGRAVSYLHKHQGATALVTKSILESIPYTPYT